MAIVVNVAPSEEAALSRISQIVGQLGGVRYVGVPSDGQAWGAMMQSIRDCSVFVTPVADAVAHTPSIMPALNYASALGKPIVLVITGPTAAGVPNPNPGDVLIDYRTPDSVVDARVADAVRAGVRGARPLPSPLPVEPIIPIAPIPGAAAGWSPPLGSQSSPPAVSVPQFGGSAPVHPVDTPNHGGVEQYSPTKDSGAGSSSKRGWILAAAIGVVAVLVGGVIAGNVLVRGSDGSGEETSNTATPPTGGELEAALLTVSELNTIAGVTNLPPLKSYGIPEPSSELEQAECDPVFNAAMGSLYDDTGFSHLRGGHASVMEPVPAFVDQVAVAFPTEQAADALFASAAESWDACANRVVNRESPDSGTVHWVVGPLDRQPDRIASVLLQEGAGGWSCQHVMGRRGMVIVESRCATTTLPTRRDGSLRPSSRIS